MPVRTFAGEEVGILEGVPNDGSQVIGRIGHACGETGADIHHVELQLDEVVLGPILPPVEVPDDGGGLTEIEFSERDIKVTLTADFPRQRACFLWHKTDLFLN